MVIDMIINYEHYRIFYYVAKYKNITQAATALMSSQPNVTRTIKQMEKKLGCQLFIRVARGVELTEEGQRLYEHVAIAYEHLETGEKELSERLSLKEGIVTIGTGETALHLLLLKKLKEFHSLYPKVRLKLTNCSTPQSIKALNSGAVDFAVVTDPDIKALPKKVKSIHIESFKDILIAGNQYEYLAKKKLSLPEVAEMPFVCLDKSTRTYELYRDLFLSRGAELEPDIEVATSDMILPVVENGLGVGFVPEPFAKKALKENRVFKLNLKDTIPERGLYLLKDGERSLSTAANELQKFLRE